MEELMELLEEIQPDADFENCDTLIDDGILDSFAILSIVSELQDTYEITITPADIIPENFNSAKALWDMVCRFVSLRDWVTGCVRSEKYRLTGLGLVGRYFFVWEFLRRMGCIILHCIGLRRDVWKMRSLRAQMQKGGNSKSRGIG